MPVLGHRVDGEILCSSQEAWDFGGKRGWDGVGVREARCEGRGSSQGMRNFTGRQRSLDLIEFTLERQRKKKKTSELRELKKAVL